MRSCRNGPCSPALTSLGTEGQPKATDADSLREIIQLGVIRQFLQLTKYETLNSLHLSRLLKPASPLPQKICRAGLSSVEQVSISGSVKPRTSTIAAADPGCCISGNPFDVAIALGVPEQRGPSHLKEVMATSRLKAWSWEPKCSATLLVEQLVNQVTTSESSGKALASWRW